MNFKYEYVFFKYLYEKLNLKKLEEQLTNNGIKPYDENNISKRISKYFSLVSTGTSDNFSKENIERFNYYFSKDISELLTEPLYSAVIDFILKTYQNYFYSDATERYKYYGPTSFEYMAPTDSIVLGLNYIKYDLPEEQYNQELARQDRAIVDVLNYIQTDLSKVSSIKLSAIAYNEVVLNQPFLKI